MFQLFLFYLLAAIILLAAIGVVTARNPVYAALSLILSFFSSAALWILLQAEFLGIVLILVYVGAVMVLFLFIIMMIDVGTEYLKESFVRYLPIGLAVAVVIAVEFILVLQSAGFDNPDHYKIVEHADNYDHTEALGEVLFTQYIYPFEIAAVLLLVAIIAAITLTLRRRPGVKSQDIAKQLRVKREDRVRLVKMDNKKS